MALDRQFGSAEAGERQFPHDASPISRRRHAEIAFHHADRREAVLIVRDITTRIAGRANPRPLPRSGRVRAGRVLQQQFVAFIGIRRTSRRARVNPNAIFDWARSSLPALIKQALR